MHVLTCLFLVREILMSQFVALSSSNGPEQQEVSGFLLRMVCFSSMRLCQTAT